MRSTKLVRGVVMSVRKEEEVSRTVVRESYVGDVDYEALQGALNAEIGYHANTARLFGYESDEGRKHMDLARRFVGLQRSISPKDKVLLEAVAATVQTSRLIREAPRDSTKTSILVADAQA